MALFVFQVVFLMSKSINFEKALCSSYFSNGLCLLTLRNTAYTKVTKIFFLVFFPDSSVGKESACNAGDSGSIPGSGRPAGEGIGYPLQHSWASLVTQLVRNHPMRETWIQSLGWEDPLEKGMATQSSILVWRIPMDRGAWQATVYGATKSWT